MEGLSCFSPKHISIYGMKRSYFYRWMNELVLDKEERSHLLFAIQVLIFFSNNSSGKLPEFSTWL